MELLERSMDAPEDERQAFIRAATSARSEVIARALTLLKAEQRSVADLATGGARLSDGGHDDENSPDRIGAYRILRLLGRGGMGSVYLGKRDADNFEHVVTIKLIKQKLLSESLIARFQRERQILARLNHPHIARLYDGGETQAGAPYIVMEYVDGLSLAEWLAEERPDLARRLDLFAQIYDAVSFAHQNLMIHPDLTPGNVLVSAGDQAKLIDFGIARPQAEDDDQADASTLSGLSLTPGYSVPERALGQAANTLSDICIAIKRLEALHCKLLDNDDVTRSLAKAQYAFSIFIFIAEYRNEGSIAPASRSINSPSSITGIARSTRVSRSGYALDDRSGTQ